MDHVGCFSLGPRAHFTKSVCKSQVKTRAPRTCLLLLWRVPSGLASGGGFKKMPVAWLSLNYIGIDDLGRTPVASLRALFSSQLHRD